MFIQDFACALVLIHNASASHIGLKSSPEPFIRGSLLITHEFAAQFAEDWIASWNAHDLSQILSHYADDFEMLSPYIVQIAGEPSGVLKGKAAVAAYWAKALAQMPALKFELHSVLIGVDSLVIYYRGVKGMAAELFFFDAHGKIVKACAHYA